MAPTARPAEDAMRCGTAGERDVVPNPNLVAARRREWCGGRRGRGERVAARSGRAARWGERRRAGGGAERASAGGAGEQPDDVCN